MSKKKKNNKKKIIGQTDLHAGQDGYPKISILTPLYSRNKWLPLMILNIISFDYDKNKMEWFILDSKDGDEDIKLFNNEEEIEVVKKMIHPIKLKYVYLNRKMAIGEKRTYLTKNMSHKWFANMDSDDIYFDQYLKYSIDLCKNNKVGLSGSPQMIFIWPHLDYKISAIECSAKRQCHEATFVGTKQYVGSMGYYTKNDDKGEGASLIDGNEKNVIKSECKDCMMCVAHNRNSCNKDTFQDANVQDFKASGSKIDLLMEIMREEVEIEGRKNLSQFTINGGETDKSVVSHKNISDNK